MRTHMFLLPLIGFACAAEETRPSRDRAAHDSASDPSEAPPGTADDTGSRASPTITDLVVSVDPEHVTEHTLEIALDVPGRVEVVCTDLSDPEEQHILKAAGANSYQLPLHGLLPGALYDCSADTPAGSAWPFEVAVAPLPDGLYGPTLEVLDEANLSGAYTLLNHWEVGSDQNDKLLIVDPEGRVRWYYLLRERSDPGLESTLLADGRILLGGGQGYLPRLLDLSGNTLYTVPDPWIGGKHHHDVVQLPSGELLMLVSDAVHSGDVLGAGFALEARIPYDDTVTWTFRSQDAVHRGELVVPPDTNSPFHANAIAYVEDTDGPAVYVSLAEANQIVRVDWETRQVTWKLGVNGDFTFLDAAGVPLEEGIGYFYFQHDPQVAFPRVLLHDNGVARPEGRYTRALELELDIDARTATVVQEWTEEGWYEPHLGGVQKLTNGHWLIAKGNRESASHTHSAILEVDPQSGDVVHELTFESSTDGLYRAHRIDGCAIFANARYCPSLEAVPH